MLITILNFYPEIAAGNLALDFTGSDSASTVTANVGSADPASTTRDFELTVIAQP